MENCVYAPEHPEEYYSGEEYCPQCGKYIPYHIGKGDYTHYEFVCPECGSKLMLCNLCNLDYGDICDWDPQTTNCKLCKACLNPADKVYIDESTGYCVRSSWLTGERS